MLIDLGGDRLSLQSSVLLDAKIHKASDKCFESSSCLMIKPPQELLNQIINLKITKQIQTIQTCTKGGSVFRTNTHSFLIMRN